MECDKRMLPLLSSTDQERGYAQFAKLWKIIFGFNKSTPKTDYHWDTSCNSTSFEKCLEPCTLTKTPQTQLLPMPSLVWKPWAPPKYKNLLGWSFKIECGRWIDLSKEGDQIVGYARFVTKCKNRARIFYLNALHHSNLDGPEELARSP
jgi:hypothetical protein